MLPTRLRIGPALFGLRSAVEADLPAIVGLLVDDQLGRGRESAATLAPYETAFAAIDNDPAQTLIVVTDGDDVIGTLQLTVIPGLSRLGATRGQLEGVRVRSDYQSRGLGAAMMAWAIEEARERGCTIVQLTSDKTRADAHRFYERLGFSASHEGFKLIAP